MPTYKARDPYAMVSALRNFGNTLQGLTEQRKAEEERDREYLLQQFGTVADWLRQGIIPPDSATVGDLQQALSGGGMELEAAALGDLVASAQAEAEKRENLDEALKEMLGGLGPAMPGAGAPPPAGNPAGPSSGGAPAPVAAGPPAAGAMPPPQPWTQVGNVATIDPVRPPGAGGAPPGPAGPLAAGGAPPPPPVPAAGGPMAGGPATGSIADPFYAIQSGFARQWQDDPYEAVQLLEYMPESVRGMMMDPKRFSPTGNEMFWSESRQMPEDFVKAVQVSAGLAMSEGQRRDLEQRQAELQRQRDADRMRDRDIDLGWARHQLDQEKFDAGLTDTPPGGEHLMDVMPSSLDRTLDRITEYLGLSPDKRNQMMQTWIARLVELKAMYGLDYRTAAASLEVELRTMLYPDAFRDDEPRASTGSPAPPPSASEVRKSAARAGG